MSTMDVDGRGEAGATIDVASAAKRLRRRTLVGLALSSVLPLLTLAYVVNKYVLPVLDPTDTLSFFALQGLMLSATLAMIAGGYVTLERQANEIEAFAGRLDRANAELETTNRKLEDFSFKDAVTGLYNRRFFAKRLEEEMARHRRFGHPVSVVLIDLDGFKAVNDELGHPVGDATLREVGEILTSQSRGINVIARPGGDEFAVLLVETAKDGARAYAERIRHALASHRFTHDKPITGSFGIASVPVDGSSSPDEIVRVADAALYAAKRAGKNRVVALPDPATPPGDAAEPDRKRARPERLAAAV